MCGYADVQMIKYIKADRIGWPFVVRYIRYLHIQTISAHLNHILFNFACVN
jgi:hypothetical protein